MGYKQLQLVASEYILIYWGNDHGNPREVFIIIIIYFNTRKKVEQLKTIITKSLTIIYFDS